MVLNGRKFFCMFFPRLVNMKLNVSQDLGELYGMLISHRMKNKDQLI